MNPSKELAALRKDRERLDWLTKNGGTWPLTLEIRGWQIFTLPGYFRTPRLALDAAMRQSRGAK